ncbi:hypothetical protein BgAZ_103300 [Babesia gibsoni]|uniref:Tudor domain-containing protein n=1 Tax=Babesia gibsoni TaxID=33632 RepID=A0AAD8PFP3_BABGI|nr:hypothetical protein BgAZ_103300 [Babesia gibsoni]
MDQSETYEELQAKINEYTEQVQLVEEALQQDPDNAELKALRHDLREVIELTEDLIKFKVQNEQAPPSAVLEHKIPESYEATTVSGGNTQYIGKICVVLFNGKQRYGQIIRVEGELPTDAVIIELIGTGQQCSLAAKDLKLLEPPPLEECKAGTLVQVLYAEDGRWYDAVINRGTDEGYVITYKDYNVSEEVKPDRVRLKQKNATKTKDVREIITPAGYKIPENLIIKQNDNEKEKMRKKKLVQTLKKQQKAERIEAEAKNRANSWRKFQEKAGSRSKSGYMTGKREGSIFSITDDTTTLSAPTSLHNSFVPRKRFDYNERF